MLEIRSSFSFSSYFEKLDIILLLRPSRFRVCGRFVMQLSFIGSESNSILSLLTFSTVIAMVEINVKSGIFRDLWDVFLFGDGSNHSFRTPYRYLVFCFLLPGWRSSFKFEGLDLCCRLFCYLGIIEGILFRVEITFRSLIHPSFPVFLFNWPAVQV